GGLGQAGLDPLVDLGGERGLARLGGLELGQAVLGLLALLLGPLLGLLGPLALVPQVLAGGGELVGDVGAAPGGQVDQGLALGDVERVGVVEDLDAVGARALADVAVDRHGGLLVLEGVD